MKKYIVKVNGKSYEVELEEVREGVSSSASSPQPLVSNPKPQTTTKAVEKKPQPKPAAPKAQPAPQGTETISAPMPGTILEIKVNQGDTVTEGQVLLLLEAMKMENEIVAPRSGKVAAINTAKGASVNTGDPLISLE